ncbi:MAG: iron export ABC transporter permease subunit FetB [Halorhodospira halophila]|uniref:ABC transporter permease n=1 Tax=Halorhodospira TaxID=85108 RepID=UPI0019148498|nr:iron export ABC transporter permease subunit FetB [Halorhodospira halophila]MCG5532967.1 iron export ABC transporter permease subunit FetB [Halorhodospira sp. 9621]MCG5538578.1 iron export ABC transporter permease subunit FetB [Halorhodospira sp. 9622]MCG5540812.1 iron export ABC transporter permease subunit FetB [Halorhodospira sp. M39old]MCG5543506.1 iron export ABC transporter permease subunit FetB [Halorhodospira sp. 9628]MCG5546052.1 iron export ABC transporter permease subunit FetB [H
MTQELIRLEPLDLVIAGVLVVALAGFSWAGRLGVERSLLIAAARTVIQLLLVGLVLETLFAHATLYWVALMGVVMLLVAGYEVMARQKRRFAGFWGFGLGTAAMFLSSFSVAVLALIALVQPQPWYQPQYAIPLLGMLLGNTMNGIALSVDRLTDGAWQQRDVIEARLALGEPWGVAVEQIRRDAMRSGMIPMINAMAAAGIVSLPGMMTGQILAGAPPMEAVKYQILIMFLITVGTGFGTLAAVWFAARRLFDERERLRLDRLR